MIASAFSRNFIHLHWKLYLEKNKVKLLATSKKQIFWRLRLERKILVLGGHGDIGRSIVQKFEESGEQVSAPSREELDLSKFESIHRFFSHNQNDFDVFINSAGWNHPKPCEDISADELNYSFQVNTLSFFEILKWILPSLKSKKEGYVLAISSIYGSFSRINRLAYSTSKHALNGMIKTLALELGSYNIKVNSLSPGFVDTKMTRKNNSPEVIQSLIQKTALKRLATVEDIAEVSYFLCSVKNQYIHGQDIIVDGGYSVGGFQN